MTRFTGEFTSNTLAGSANQNWFKPENPTELYTGRVFYKLFSGGNQSYSLLYSNGIDTTFADGQHSYAERQLKSWTIHKLSVGICPPNVDFTQNRLSHMHPVLFGGEPQKSLEASKRVMTDSINLSAQAGDYLCVEVTFSGEEVPCHTELIIPCFCRKAGKFVPSTEVPVPGLIGSDRPVFGQIGFLGDSITQGIGTPANKYTHWTAEVAKRWGNNWAYWNLGVGYARASDAAKNGAWLSKAMCCDFVSICLGVNDIKQGCSAELIEQSLQEITTQLYRRGIAYGIFTIPPFDYDVEATKRWEQVNSYIKKALSANAAYVFDTAAVLGSPDDRSKPIYGAHPNELGCEKLAEAFCRKYKSPKEIFENKRA